MENIARDNEPPLTPPTFRPLLLLLLGGWGIAASGDGNIIRQAKIPNWLNLVKEYPVASLRSGELSLNARYLTLGAGQEISEESFQPEATLAQVLSSAGRRQLKIAETERFAALTHFFNGQAEEKVLGEEWTIISSENSKKIVKFPLALRRTVKEIIKSLDKGIYDFIVASIPTVDLVADTGDLGATKKAAEALDKSLREIVEKVLSKNGIIVITSEAGKAERMLMPGTDMVSPTITDSPLPVLLISNELKGKTIGLADPLSTDLSLLDPIGNLADIAPTILSLMGIPAPSSMRGESILDRKKNIS